MERPNGMGRSSFCTKGEKNMKKPKPSPAPKVNCDDSIDIGNKVVRLPDTPLMAHSTDKRRLAALLAQFSGFAIGDIPLSRREMDDIFDFLGKVRHNTPELLTPQHAYIWETLAYAYNSRGNLARMEHCLRSQAAFQPGLTDAFINLGAFLVAHGLYARAVRAYVDGLQVDPDCEYLSYNLASLYCELGNRKLALQAVNEAILANPERGINHKLKADILVEYEDYHAAILTYRTAIPLFLKETNAVRLGALLGLTRAFEANNDHQNAVETLFDALALDPCNVSIMAHMASIMGHKAGRWDAAKDAIDMALRLDETHAPLWRLAADYYKATGQKFSQMRCEQIAREITEGR